MEEKKLPAKKSQPIVKKVWKGQETFEHHLFKLSPTDCIKNKSITPYQPNTYRLQHGHVYHTVDRKGKPQTYSAPSSGHFHEVTVEWDGDTLVGVKCGPPTRFKYRQQRNKEIKKVKEQVVYKGRDENGDDDVVDSHTHEIVYIRGEVLTLQPQQHDHTQGHDYLSKKYNQSVLAQAQAITKQG